MSQLSSRDRLRLLGAASAAMALPGAFAAATDKYPRNLTKDDIDRWMTELSNWGRWGKDDQAGTVNLITNAKRRQAAALVKEGVSVSMSLDADIAPKSAPPPSSADLAIGGTPPTFPSPPSNRPR